MKAVLIGPWSHQCQQRGKTEKPRACLCPGPGMVITACFLWGSVAGPGLCVCVCEQERAVGRGAQPGRRLQGGGA